MAFKISLDPNPFVAAAGIIGARVSDFTPCRRSCLSSSPVRGPPSRNSVAMPSSVSAIASISLSRAFNTALDSSDSF